MTKDKLYLNDETAYEDIVEYVKNQMANPRQPDGRDDIRVYNFHNSPMVSPEFAEWAESAESGLYVVPYQVSGVWAAMTEILPEDIAEADVLVYRRQAEKYQTHPNWLAEARKRTREVPLHG